MSQCGYAFEHWDALLEAARQADVVMEAAAEFIPNPARNAMFTPVEDRRAGKGREEEMESSC